MKLLTLLLLIIAGLSTAPATPHGAKLVALEIDAKVAAAAKDPLTPLTRLAWTWETPPEKT